MTSIDSGKSHCDGAPPAAVRVRRPSETERITQMFQQKQRKLYPKTSSEAIDDVFVARAYSECFITHSLSAIISLSRLPFRGISTDCSTAETVNISDLQSPFFKEAYPHEIEYYLKVNTFSRDLPRRTVGLSVNVRN